MANFQVFNQRALRAVEKLMSTLTEKSKEIYVLQGHDNTGAGLKSFEFEVTANQDGYQGIMYVLDYVLKLETGVKPGDILKGTNLIDYIQDLVNYFQLRGLPTREAQAAATGTARAHLREGLPTRRSRRFSSDGGRRTGFINRAVTQNQNMVVNLLVEDIGNAYEITIRELATNSLTLFKATG